MGGQSGQIRSRRGKGWVSTGVAQDAFNASSIGQVASVTCVPADRVPINPAIHISRTSLNRSPVGDTRGRRPDLGTTTSTSTLVKERTGSLAVRV